MLVRACVGAWDFNAFFFHLRKLDDRQHRLPSFQPPANAAADPCQPGTKGLGMLKLVQMPICPEKRLDQNIFRVLSVAANAQHLTVDCILVLIRQRLEVHLFTHASIVPWRRVDIAPMRFSDCMFAERRFSSAGSKACEPAVCPSCKYRSRRRS